MLTRNSLEFKTNFRCGLAVNPLLLGVLVYVGLQLLLGLLVSRRIKDEQDYLLAGRSLGLGLATFSLFATWFGAESCVSAAGKVYEHGLSGATADPFGYGACLLFMGLVFAVPLWRRKFTTLADLFRARYSVGIERLAVLIMVPTSIFWAAAQIRAFGQVFDATAGIGIEAGICLGAGVAILYTAAGGLRADVVTDLFQGILIIIGLLVLFVLVVADAGGISAAWSGIEPERLRIFAPEQPFWETLDAWAIPICGSVVAQELVARILAAKSPEVAKRASLLGGGLYILVGLIPVFIGLIGLQMMPGLKESEQILPLMAQKHLSTFFQILFLGALVSAILSTVDSTLLAAAALASHNLIIPIRPAMSETAKVNTARGGVVVGGLLALDLALQSETIHELVQSASSFGSAGIFVVMVFGLFTKVGGKRAAAASMLAGVVVWAIGTWAVELPCAYLISLGAALAAYLAAAPFDKKPAD